MSYNDFKNAEHYDDPTAYEAIKRIEISEKRKKYIKKKLEMLYKEFLIQPTKEDIEALFKCENESSIDRMVVYIIKKHWEED